MSIYKIENRIYPSVTTVLGILDKSSALMPWVAKMVVKYCHDEIAEHIDQTGDTSPPLGVLTDILEESKKNYRKISREAMDIGSEIHKLIELYIKEGQDAVGDLRPEVENGFLAFLEWEKDNISEWLESEMTVFDDDMCIGGTLDAVAKMNDGRILVIDFKSSKGFYDGYAQQIAVYRYCYETMKEVRVDGEAVLRLDKATGEPEYKDYTKGHERALDTFKAVLRVYYLQKDRRCKNNPIVNHIKEKYNVK